MTTKTDILVSGAGPTGLFFAYQMAQRGHSVFIVDPKPGPTDQSRAILITARTMEVLESQGLAADILREAFVFPGMRMFRDGSIVSIQPVWRLSCVFMYAYRWLKWMLVEIRHLLMSLY